MNNEEFKALSLEEQNRLIEFQKAKSESDGKKLIEEKDGTYTRVNLSEAEEYETRQKFKKKNLFEMIIEEISKYHLKDNNLKATLFLIAVSSLLKNPKRRMSMQITGNTSVGKDNLIHAIIKHIVKDVFIFLTSGTQSVLEDDLADYRLICISEINLFKERGANKNLLEVIKQRTEGGVTAFKKDLRDKNKSLRISESEQGSVIFGTIDVETDEEAITRVMKGTIQSSYDKIKYVNENTFDTFADEEKIIGETSSEDNWVRKGLSYFFNNSNQYEILIPYSKYLKEKINGKEIFDYSDARSQRDIKRLLSLTCAMTWIYQEQREKKEYKGINFLISEPEDFIKTLQYTSGFFNQTYTGFDARLNAVLNFMDSYESEWVDKKLIQKELSVTKNTINTYCRNLVQEGFIEGSKGVQLNEEEGVKIYDGNRIYYKRVQKEFKKSLIRVEIEELKNHLINKKGSKKEENKEIIEELKDNPLGFEEKDTSEGKIEPFELNPLKEKPIEIIKIGSKKENSNENKK